MERLDGRYRLEAEIAHGGVGVVWRATDRATGAPVAVKVPRPEVAVQPDLVAGFRTEAELLAVADHPSVIRIIEQVEDPDRGPALVMELVEGEDLRHRLRRDGPVPPPVAASIAAQVAAALAHLHGRGIVHGDVKPANLLVPADGGPVRLADFGVARRTDDGDRPVQATPEYVAPEVVAGAPPQPATDVYALGIVLFELLSGRSPFRGGPASQVLGRHGSCAPVPPPGLPAVLWPLIEECLASRAGQRPSAGHLAARLRAVEPVLDGLPALPPPSPEQVTWWPRPAGGATAVARVSWVPLPVAPVSPASVYAGRMVAVPLAAMPDGARAAAPSRAAAGSPEGQAATGSGARWIGPGPGAARAGFRSSRPWSGRPRQRRRWLSVGAALVFVAGVGAVTFAAGGSAVPAGRSGVVPVSPAWEGAPPPALGAGPSSAPRPVPHGLPGVGQPLPAMPGGRAP